ncbi:K02A2.6-like [Cordylochernes scorpioides]|uniref:K02A2.6-like n=1 Tax=Cordylochernes scorpioides TaxID=51811 RepID=A0ABY6LMZ9_9ARAC|nr:K02A2.6-like [Cordylochernes scorpioides]
MATIKKFESYDTNKDCESYIECLEQYFIFKNFQEEKKVPALIALIGKDTYGLSKNLCDLEKPSNKSFEFLVDKLQNHFNPIKVYKSQAGNFIAALNKSKKCNFNSTLEDSLCDQVVEGVRDENVLRRFLAKPD